jgi:hypothetical protein
MFEPPPLCLFLNRWDPDRRTKLLLAFASIQNRCSPALPEKREVDLYEQEWRHSGTSPAAVCLTRNQYDTDLPKEKSFPFFRYRAFNRKAPLLGCEQLQPLPARHVFILYAIATPNV